ncbi:MAG: regulatory iron-sulfur-containing complex subunit RicT, partial [Thermodesulfobacteriota bacterium]
PGDPVMIRTEHNPEPAVIVCRAPDAAEPGMERGFSYGIIRRATREEGDKYARLPILENEAYAICQDRINYLRLPMYLVRVERFFNGSKIIFYFTAESRVDFRELVKNMVQEFRTRVEMRQIGVRHETQMTGGIGACGRELCCTSFLRKFESVSIKMAKTQDLPLNPAKISGVCNRLLCCLTYEYKTYHKLRKGMPKPGRTFEMDGIEYKVTNCNILNEKVTIMPPGEPDQQQVISKEEWLEIRGPEPQREPKSKGRQHKAKKGGKHPHRKKERKDSGRNKQNRKQDTKQSKPRSQDESS